MTYYYCNFEMFQNLKMFQNVFAILTVVTACWHVVTACWIVVTMAIDQDAQGSAHHPYKLSPGHETHIYICMDLMTKLD
jgi:hypothetical protein